MTTTVLPFDAHDAARPFDPPPALTPFVAAGVLHAADVHVAMRLAGAHPEVPDAVLLGAALAVRAPRQSHVCVDLGRVPSDVVPEPAADGTVPALAWPDPDAWLAALAAHPLVAVGDDPGPVRPLRLVGALLYLDRYWRDERQVADNLLRRAEHPVSGVDMGALRAGLDALFPPDAVQQRVAAATAVLRRLTVIGGGPGTGKTTTIARLLALLDRLEPVRPRLVALAAPTGKAAARLQEAVHAEAEALADAANPETRDHLLALRGSTLHRLLGRHPASDTRFRHDRANRLPHRVVIVDEASMASLTLVARLLEALRDDARLVLVGDPDQLASVEAGAVLGDIVGPARDRPLRRPAATALLAEALGAPVPAEPAPEDAPVGDGVTILTRVHRFGGAIAELADAVRRGDADRTIAVLESGAPEVVWHRVDPAVAGDGDIPAVRDAAIAAGTALIRAARAGDIDGALDALGQFRLLCPHRRGPHGVEAWEERVERWLVPAGAVPGTWYPGRPLMVTENDYMLRLFNGDTGAIVRRHDRTVAVFSDPAGAREISPSRLAAVSPVHAMTIHKSQGSQFDTVAVLVAPAGSPISTRELLYTAVTRARERALLSGDEAAIRAAVIRPVARASGLRRRLWSDLDKPDGRQLGGTSRACEGATWRMPRRGHQEERNGV